MSSVSPVVVRLHCDLATLFSPNLRQISLVTLRTSEWIAFAYFLYLAVAALGFHLDGWRRRRAVGVALLAAASVPSMGGPAAAQVVRDWLPLAWILAGYWLPALLVTRTNQSLERALLALDRRWFGRSGIAAFVERAPRAVIELLEVAYLFCYPLVPAGFAALYAAGLRDEVDRFWTAVLLAVFSCYSILPWLPTEPPRRLEERSSPAVRSPTRAVNLRVLDRASIHLNTFPSGHAAAAIATALAVSARMPWTGALFGVLAIGISVGSVVGRYHYAADAITGALVAAFAFALSRLV